MTNRAAPIWIASTFAFAVVATTSAMVFAQGLVVPKAQPAAGAEGAAAPRPPADWTNYNTRPLTPTGGMLQIHLDLVDDLTAGQGGKPFWITPNVFYGVTDVFSIGIAENPQAEFLPVSGGFCLASSTYCAKVLNFLGPTVMLSAARTDTMELALHAGLDFGFQDTTMSARAGALMRFAVSGPVAILADPSVLVGITRRSQGNEEALRLPIRVGLEVMPQVNVGLVTGVNGELDGTPGFSKTYAIPLGFAGLLSGDKVDFGANFTLTNLAGTHAAGHGAFTGRTIAITANYRM